MEFAIAYNYKASFPIKLFFIQRYCSHFCGFGKQHKILTPPSQNIERLRTVLHQTNSATWDYFLAYTSNKAEVKISSHVRTVTFIIYLFLCFLPCV